MAQIEHPLAGGAAGRPGAQARERRYETPGKHPGNYSGNFPGKHPGEHPDNHPRRLAGAFNLVAAATSLAILVGIGVWGYKMVMRDVSGVPVIRAAKGPMRVRPEDPGGEQALYQGLAVNAVAAGDGAEKRIEQVILAPAPLDLAFDDTERPAGEGRPAALAGDDGAKTSGAARTVAFVQPAPGATASASASAPAPAPEAAPGRQAGVEGGLGRSLRPRLRPGSLGISEAVTRALADVGAVHGIDPATIAPGTRLAQLGAFASREIALREWDRMTVRFGDYLADKERVIQKATSGGRSFYRLRAMGFADMSAARRFCSALMDQGAECIPVTIR